MAMVVMAEKQTKKKGVKMKAKVEVVKRRILTARTNQYGNIAIEDGKDKDGKIVHIEGQRLSLTCKANGIDYRVCVVGFDKHRGRYFPIYNGVYVAMQDADRLKDAILKRDVKNQCRIDRAKEKKRRQEEQQRKQEEQIIAGFHQAYPNIDDALPDVCDAVFNLNRYAKTDGCDKQERYKIYANKNRLVDYLYHNDYCYEVIRHEKKLAALTCNSCDGSGFRYNGDDCFKCGGTGIFRENKTVVYVSLRFKVGQKTYSWHQPEEDLNFTPIITSETVPMPEIERKGIQIPLAEIPKAILLVNWFFKQIDVNKAA